jgi:hypothetical protein
VAASKLHRRAVDAAHRHGEFSSVRPHGPSIEVALSNDNAWENYPVPFLRRGFIGVFEQVALGPCG